jgi:hypothetical protein
MSEKDIDLAALDRDLQKLGKPPRGWFSSNWKWFVPVLLLLILLVGGGIAYYLIYQRVFSHEAYQQSMSKILENKEIKESLGEPVKTRFTNPGPSIRQDSTETNILWTLAGSSGKEAKAHVFQRLMDGKWETIIAEVTLPSGKKVSLIDEEEGGAPPFQPQAAPAPEAKTPDKPATENMPDDLSPKIPAPEETK